MATERSIQKRAHLGCLRIDKYLKEHSYLYYITINITISLGSGPGAQPLLLSLQPFQLFQPIIFVIEEFSHVLVCHPIVVIVRAKTVLEKCTEEVFEEWKKRLKIIIHFVKNGVVKITQMTQSQMCHLPEGMPHFKQGYSRTHHSPYFGRYSQGLC